MPRRQFERRKIQVTAVVKDTEGKPIVYPNRDISMGGIFLVSQNPRAFPYSVGDTFQMDLQFYASTRKIPVMGRVARLTRESSVEAQMHKPGIGVEFTQVDPDGKKIFKVMLR